MAANQIRAGGAYVEIVADDRKLKKGLRQAQNHVRSFSESVKSIGTELLSIAAIGGSGFVLPLRSFAKFDDQMRITAAISRATRREMNELRKSARDLGATTAFTAQQVAEGQTSFARMGFGARDIKVAMKPALDLVRATGNATETLGRASLAVGKVLRSFNLSVDEKNITDVVDVLTAASNMSSTDLWSFMESLKLVGPVARDAGADLRDVASQLMVLADNGLSGTEAGTALRRAYVALTKDGGKKFDELGVKIKDASGNLRPMSNILRDLSAALKNMPNAEKLEKLRDIFDIRGMTAVSNLLNNVGQLDSIRSALGNISGYADRLAKSMESGIGGELRKLIAAAEEFNLALGEAFSGNGGSGLVKQFADAIRTLAAAIKELAPAIGIIGKLGAYMLIFKGMRSIFTGLAGAIAPFSTRFDAMVKSAWGFSRASGPDARSVRQGALSTARFAEDRKNYAARRDKELADIAAWRSAKSDLGVARNAAGAAAASRDRYSSRATLENAVNLASRDRDMVTARRKLMDDIALYDKEIARVNGQRAEWRQALRSVVTGNRRRNRAGRAFQGAKWRDFGTRVFAKEDLDAAHAGAADAGAALERSRKEHRIASQLGAASMTRRWVLRSVVASANASRRNRMTLYSSREDVRRSGHAVADAWEHYEQTQKAQAQNERRFAELGGAKGGDNLNKMLVQLEQKRAAALNKLVALRQRQVEQTMGSLSKADAQMKSALDKQVADAQLAVERAQAEYEKTLSAARASSAGRRELFDAGMRSPIRRSILAYRNREMGGGTIPLAVGGEASGSGVGGSGGAIRDSAASAEASILGIRKAQHALAQLDAGNKSFMQTLRRRIVLTQGLARHQMNLANSGLVAGRSFRYAAVMNKLLAGAMKASVAAALWLKKALEPLLSPTNILLMGVATAWWAINKAIDAHNQKIRDGIDSMEEYLDKLRESTNRQKDAGSESGTAAERLREADKIVSRGGMIDQKSRDTVRASIQTLLDSGAITGDDQKKLLKYFGLEKLGDESWQQNRSAARDILSEVYDPQRRGGRVRRQTAAGYQKELDAIKAELAKYEELVKKSEDKQKKLYGVEGSDNKLSPRKNSEALERLRRLLSLYQRAQRIADVGNGMMNEDQVKAILNLEKRQVELSGLLEGVNKGAIYDTVTRKSAAPVFSKGPFNAIAMDALKNANLETDKIKAAQYLNKVASKYFEKMMSAPEDKQNELWGNYFEMKDRAAQLVDEYTNSYAENYKRSRKESEWNRALGGEDTAKAKLAEKEITAEIKQLKEEMKRAAGEMKEFRSNPLHFEKARRDFDTAAERKNNYQQMLDERKERLKEINSSRVGAFGDFSAAAAIMGVGGDSVQERIAASNKKIEQYTGDMKELFEYNWVLG